MANFRFGRSISWPRRLAVGACVFAGVFPVAARAQVLPPTQTPSSAQTPTPTPAPVRLQGRGPLGAGPKRIAELYGPVLRHNARVRRHQVLEGGTVIDGDLYGKNGLVIRVVYYAGASVLLEYTRAAGALTDKDVNLILAEAADGSSWTDGKDNTEARRTYRRADGRAVAQYTAEYDGSLLIAAENPGDDFYNDKLLGH